MGYIDVPTADSYSELQVLGVVITELVVGLSAGLIITIAFSAAVLAGEKIATSGWSWVCSSEYRFRAQELQLRLSQRCFLYFLVVLFLGMNGHLVVIRTMLEATVICQLVKCLLLEF